jgi:hypothetical protein
MMTTWTKTRFRLVHVGGTVNTKLWRLDRHGVAMVMVSWFRCIIWLGFKDTNSSGRNVVGSSQDRSSLLLVWWHCTAGR